MPKRKKPPEKPEQQFQRFLEAAREADVDSSAADKVFRRISTRNNDKGNRPSTHSKAKSK